MTTHEPWSWTYAYLSLSVALTLVWIVVYVLRHDLGASMWRVSLYTGLLGLTEPLFVPRYWNPFTLFDLAHRTGFDLESLLFAFSIGGIAFAGYEFLFHVGPFENIAAERNKGLHRQHTLAVLSAPVLFGILSVTTRLNPIYSSAIALVAGFFATLYCRRDLWLKMIVSGGLFFAIYFFVFALFNLAFPGYVQAVWNLKAISGLRLVGVPLEELMFAFTFGLYWSSVYEHFSWHGQRAFTPVRVELGSLPAQKTRILRHKSTGVAEIAGSSSGIWQRPVTATEFRSIVEKSNDRAGGTACKQVAVSYWLQDPTEP